MDGDTIRVPRRDVTRDPREDEDWFQRLPPDVQEETREAWRRRRVQHDPWYGRQAKMGRRCVVEGLVVLLVPSFLMGFAGWAPLGTAALLGPFLGWI